MRNFIAGSIGPGMPKSNVRFMWLANSQGWKYPSGQPAWVKDVPIPDMQPDYTTDWVALSITDFLPERGSAVKSFNGRTFLVIRHRILNVNLIFYGPKCTDYATTLEQTVWLGADTEEMDVNDLGFVAIDSVSHQPELLHDIWYPRVDITLRLRERIDTQFGISTFTNASGILISEGSKTARTPFIVQEPK